MVLLYNDDCTDILRHMEDNSLDIILTDPPYGIEYLSNHYKDGNPFSEIIGDDEFPAYLIPEFKRIAKKAVFVFCRWDNLIETEGLEKPKSFIVWVKNNWGMGDLQHEFGRMWEGILFYPCEEHEFEKRLPDAIHCDRVPASQLVHPTQKPVPLLEQLIRNNSKPGDTVLDPFMGSGSTGVACVRSGRNFIGIEIDETYFDTAEKEIKKAQNQLSLL